MRALPFTALALGLAVASVLPAAILKVTPQPASLPFSSSQQTLTLAIEGVADNTQSQVSLTPPGGTALPSQTLIVSQGVVKVPVTPNVEGQWQAAVTINQDSGSASFTVVKPATAPHACRVSDNPEGDQRFLQVSSVVGGLLVALFLVIVISLSAAQIKGRWSIGDALAEESSVQPVPPPPHPVMVASASRLIAVIGMIVVITTVLEIGSGITWNLFVCGAVPELSELKGFLLAMSGIFAPYIINQIREMASPSNPPAAPQPAAVPTPVVTAVAGTNPGFAIDGQFFRPDAVATFIPSAGGGPVSGRTTWVSDQRVTVSVALAPGNWILTLQNPGGAPSAPFALHI